MQGGDRGGGGVELSVELGALTGSIRELRFENAYFVILACLAGCERVAGRDARVPFRDYGVGPFIVARLRPASFQRLSLMLPADIRFWPAIVATEWVREGF